MVLITKSAPSSTSRQALLLDTFSVLPTCLAINSVIS